MVKPDFRILEGIRGAAAFLVVLNHARGVLFVGGHKYLAAGDGSLFGKFLIAIFQITSLGPNAVIVFFVLSGFSIAHSVASGGSTATFYMRRVIRLVPPAAAGLMLAWIVRAANPTTLPLTAYIPQYWSLYHEAIFYTLAPLVVAVAWRRHFAVAATMGYLCGAFLGEGGIPFMFAFNYAFYFAVGVMTYERRDLLERLVMPKPAFAATLLALAILAVLTIGTMPRTSFFVSAVASQLLIANFQSHRISTAPLRALGAMSYTLYVTHFAVIGLWALALIQLGLLPADKPASLNPWLWMTAAPVCLAAAALVYWLVERPALQVLKQLRGKREAIITAS